MRSATSEESIILWGKMNQILLKIVNFSESNPRKMEKIVLTIKDKGKLSFLMELLQQLDFIEVQQPSEKSEPTAGKKDYNFFASAGLWKNKEIDAKELREKAWNHRR